MTFILCVTLLNLVVALMSSAYEDFKDSRAAKELKELNKIILQTEIRVIDDNKFEYKYLVWV